MANRIRYLYSLLSHNTTSQNFGGLGEAILRQHLENQGYKVNKPESSKSGDWIVTRDWGERKFRRVSIEVKTSRRNKDGKWAWCISKDDKHGRTRAQEADLLCLLQVGRADIYIFLMPTAILKPTQKKISIRRIASEYRGKYSHFTQSIRDLDLFIQPYDVLGKLDISC